MKILTTVKNTILGKNIPNKELVIYKDPSPLISKSKKIGLFWTPKSGCTLAVKWFFYQTGDLDKALKYDSWIHNFRTDIFQRQDSYYRMLNKLDVNDYNFVKFTRNPYTRTVSSFFHILMLCQNTDIRMAQIKRETLDLFLPQGDSLDFRSFVDILSQNINNQLLDPHISRQYHPLEYQLVKKPLIVQIEKFEDNLAEVESKLKLNPSDIDKIFNRSHHKIKKNKTEEFVGDVIFRHTKNIPAYSQFYDEELQSKVFKIFQKDFEAYGYSKELNL